MIKIILFILILFIFFLINHDKKLLEKFNNTKYVLDNKQKINNNLKSLKTFCNIKFQKTLNSKVAIVGNGPLYDKDITKILKCDLIIQFNHAVHYHKINRCDILAIRPREDKTNKLSIVNNILKTIKKETYILPITITNDNIKLFKKTKNKLLKPILVYEDSYKKNSELSGNISVALLTTAGGLFVAIPALLIYSYLRSNMESYILEMEEVALLMVDTIVDK